MNNTLPSFNMAGEHATRLGRAITPTTAQHPGLSGIHTLADSLDAFAARYMLCEMAEKTLDVRQAAV